MLCFEDRLGHDSVDTVGWGGTMVPPGWTRLPGRAHCGVSSEKRGDRGALPQVMGVWWREDPEKKERWGSISIKPQGELRSSARSCSTIESREGAGSPSPCTDFPPLWPSTSLSASGVLLLETGPSFGCPVTHDSCHDLYRSTPYDSPHVYCTERFLRIKI